MQLTILMHVHSGTCIAMKSASSSMHNVIQSLPTYEPEFWNDRNIENVAIRQPKMKKRLSTSVDQISRIRASAFENDSHNELLDMGLTRKSQHRKLFSAEIYVQKCISNDILQPVQTLIWI